MEKNNYKPSVTQIFLLAALLVIATQIVSGFVIYHHVDDWTKRGQFGDMFGAVNAIFSGLAFAGVLVALWMQSKELSLQREELRLTRTEMEASRRAQEKSVCQAEYQAKMMLISTKIQAKNTILQVFIKREEIERMDPTRRNHRWVGVHPNTKKIETIIDEIEFLFDEAKQITMATPSD